MSLRKAVIKIEYLYNEDDHDIPITLTEIAHNGIEGNASIVWDVESDVEVTEREMAKLLREQGSDPEFLLGEDYPICPDCEQIMEFRMVGNAINFQDKTLVEECYCPDCDE